MKISKKFVAIFLIVLGLLLMAMVPLKNYLVQSHQHQAVSLINRVRKPAISMVGGMTHWFKYY